MFGDGRGHLLSSGCYLAQSLKTYFLFTLTFSYDTTAVYTAVYEVYILQLQYTVQFLFRRMV